ncbi:MAG: mycofactocin biosynthesis glycosyltransferase MftF [Pseudomonadota bacterium]
MRYRLTGGVRTLHDGERYWLTLSYPLKVILLPEAVGPAFAKLEKIKECSLEELTAEVPGVGPLSLARFLNQIEKRGFLDAMGRPDLPLHAPRIAVIIPVRNRPDEIRECLASLMEIEYPRDLTEIVVVDDGSDDHTHEVVKGFPVAFLRNATRKGASWCRNLAAKTTNAEILFFLDSDCAADPAWVAELVPVFGDPAVGAAGGRVDSFFDSSPLDRYEQVKSSLFKGSRSTDSLLEGPSFYLPSCNLAVRRDLFLSLGGFNEELEVGEDVDLCWRITAAGRVIEYRPSAGVRHRHRTRPIAFCRRRFDYGTSEPILQQLHPKHSKTVVLPLADSAFWALLAVSWIAAQALPAAAAFAWLVWDVFMRRRKTTGRGCPITIPEILSAVVRSRLGFLYQLGSFISRYYLVVAASAPFLPLAAGITALVHIGVGTMEYFIKKPRLSILSFLLFFTLEQFSYQLGVWYGCLKDRYFRPVLPRIAFSTGTTGDPSGKAIGQHD